MKKYARCEKCGKEELFEAGTNKTCSFCVSGMFVDAILLRNNTQISRRGTYEEFRNPQETDIYDGIKCRNRLPGGHYCDVIPGRLKEISRVICMKCTIRITDTTLQEVQKEDEYAIE